MGSIRSVFTWVLFCVLVALLSPISSADELKQDSLTAKQILDRMAQTYAGCKSYHDSGIVKSVIIMADGNVTIERPFTTAFVRPDRFRFEYESRFEIEEVGFNRKHRHIVWCKGKEVQTWWSIKPGIEKRVSLGIALAEATGVSGGSAHTIPALLLPEEVGGRRLTDVKEAKRVDDAKVDEVECYCIRGKCADSPITLWIEKTTFLVRRIDSETKTPKLCAEETTTYNPVIDGEITDKMLEFNPPKEK